MSTNAKKRVKLLVEHIEFPESKFPGGILIAEHDRVKGKYFAENMYGRVVELKAAWVKPEHDEDFEATYQKELAEYRKEFDEKCAAALERRRAAAAIADRIAKEAEDEKKAAELKAEQEQKAAEQKAAEDAAAEKAAAEARRNALIQEHREKAQALADAKGVVENEVKAAAEAVAKAAEEVEAVESALEKFNKNKAKQKPEFDEERAALVDALEKKKTALANATADLDYKRNELASYADMKVSVGEPEEN